jgi:hypothetical protein
MDVVPLNDVVVTPTENIVSVVAANARLVIEPEEKILEIKASDRQLVINPEINVVSVSAPGPPGPPGATGSAAGEAIVYSQTTPAASWPIAHNLGRPVGTVIRLDNGEIVNTQVDQGDLNTVVLIFPAPTTGKALVL